ncbi:MAG: BTAD domain-containing putative transcriptional regulator [Hyphomicrobium sp.]
MKPVRLRLLGGFELAWAGGPALPTRKAEALLAYLAVPLGQAHRRDKLASLLWGERGDTQARHSLAQTLHVIRKALGESGEGALISNAHTVSLAPSSVDLDVNEFEALAARRTPDAHAAAIKLYRGEMLEGVSIREEAFENWLLGEQRRLNTIALGALERLLDQQVAAGNDEAAIETARRLLALDPFQEPVHRTLMRLYDRAGNDAAAIRQYQNCAKILKQELGITPDAATHALYREIVGDRTPDRFEPPVQSAALLRRPAIAVLPFENLSGDPAQDYFSDGITEDLITDLSKISGLFVVSRNAVFLYNAKAVKPVEVSRELGVRYVLEGSVRKVGNRVRISAQLIDPSTSYHLWAERYDRDLTDIFALQDEITEKIVAALEVKLTEGEQEKVARRYTEHLEAQARKMFERAIDLGPTFAAAFAMLSYTHLREWFIQWSEDSETLDRAFEVAYLMSASSFPTMFLVSTLRAISTARWATCSTK